MAEVMERLKVSATHGEGQRLNSLLVKRTRHQRESVWGCGTKRENATTSAWTLSVSLCVSSHTSNHSCCYTDALTRPPRPARPSEWRLFRGDYRNRAATKLYYCASERPGQTHSDTGTTLTTVICVHIAVSVVGRTSLLCFLTEVQLKHVRQVTFIFIICEQIVFGRDLIRLRVLWRSVVSYSTSCSINCWHF